MVAPSASVATPPGAAAAASAASVKTYQVDGDTKITTPRGATLPVAKGWFVSESGDTFRLEDPDKQLKLTLVELEGDSAKGAIATAWRRVDPSFALEPVNVITPPPGKWDDVVQITYKTPGNLVVVSNARRKGKGVWVSIIEGDRGSLDRRGAQLQDTFSRLEAPGVVEETLAGKKPHPLEGDRLRQFVDFVERARVALGIPGAAVAVVQGGKVALEQGFGVRELGKKGDVTPSTLFLIGSTSKSLSTLLMAKAVDQKKFAWATRAKDVYPSFTLGDAELTDKLTMQHLVCACTGVPRYDMELLFSFDKVKPEAVIASMKGLKPTTKLGETFQYNNQLVAAGGYFAAHTFYPKLPLGEAYDRALKEHVLEPLGMKDTLISFDEGKRRGLAAPHDEDENGQMRVFPLSYETFVVPLRPSGGVISNVRDMAKYLQAELSSGKSVTGKQVASEANVLLRRQVQIKISEQVGYGLGFMGGAYKGTPVVEHGGATFGHRSTFLLLPEAGVGITLLANAPGPLGSLAKARLLELLFDQKPEAEASLGFVLEEKKKAIARTREQLTDPEPADVVKRIEGVYRHESLGELRLSNDKGKLTIDAGEWKSRAAWVKKPDGKKELMLLDPPLSGLSFAPREKDGRPALFLSMLQHEYLFVHP